MNNTVYHQFLSSFPSYLTTASHFSLAVSLCSLLKFRLKFSSTFFTNFNLVLTTCTFRVLINASIYQEQEYDLGLVSVPFWASDSLSIKWRKILFIYTFHFRVWNQPLQRDLFQRYGVEDILHHQSIYFGEQGGKLEYPWVKQEGKCRNRFQYCLPSS